MINIKRRHWSYGVPVAEAPREKKMGSCLYGRVAQMGWFKIVVPKIEEIW